MHSPGPKIVILAGSTRIRSLNKRLAGALHKKLANFPCDPVRLSLSDYDLPLYNGDLEAQQGPPKAAIDLARQFNDSSAIVLISPEYNGSISPLLKNALDWVSRVRSFEGKTLQPYQNRTFALGGVSPGNGAALQGTIHLRHILVTLGALVLPKQLNIGKGEQAFDEMEDLVETGDQAKMDSFVEHLINYAQIMQR